MERMRTQKGNKCWASVKGLAGIGPESVNEGNQGGSGDTRNSWRHHRDRSSDHSESPPQLVSKRAGSRDHLLRETGFGVGQGGSVALLEVGPMDDAGDLPSRITGRIGDLVELSRRALEEIEQDGFVPALPGRVGARRHWSFVQRWFR